MPSGRFVWSALVICAVLAFKCLTTAVFTLLGLCLELLKVVLQGFIQLLKGLFPISEPDQETAVPSESDIEVEVIVKVRFNK
jgi:hypothetical protein